MSDDVTLPRREVETVLREHAFYKASAEKLEAARDAAALDLPALLAEARAKGAREALKPIQAVFDLQCPPLSPDRYMDRGAWHAHSWWNKVLGGVLKDARADAATAEDTTPVDDPEIMTVFIDGAPKPKQRHRSGMVEHPDARADAANNQEPT